MFPFISGDGVAAKTATPPTRIRVCMGGGKGFTHVVNMRYTAAATAHVLTLMRGASRAKVPGGAAAAETSLVLDTGLIDGAGGDVAASDVVAVQLDNGTWHVSAVTSYTAATRTLVLTTAIPTGRTVLAGGKIVCYGDPGDAMHADQKYNAGAAATVNYPSVAGGVMSLCKASRSDEPIIFDSPNTTNAGTLEYGNVGNTLS